MANNKKKILIIVPGLGRGGMETQLVAFLRNFNRNNFEITVALFRSKISHVLPGDIRIVHLNKKFKIDILFIYRLFKLIISKKWDKVNSKISGVNEYLLMIYGFLRKENLIIEIRNSGERKKNLYMNLIFIAKLMNFKKFRVICNSQKAKMELLELERFNTSVINNGINTKRFRPEIIRNEINDGIIHIGFVGRVVKGKNIETLILAIDYFINNYSNKNLILGIWGDTPDMNYLSSLNAIIESRKLEEFVKFYKSIDDIERVYNSLDILVLPSIYEGTPNVLLEAMSCETICLISKGANSDNFLTKEFSFETKNFKQLADMLYSFLLLNVDSKIKIGQENRNFVLNKYSLKSMVESYSSLYKNGNLV